MNIDPRNMRQDGVKMLRLGKVGEAGAGAPLSHR